MPEMHLKQPDFTYSICGPFTKNKAKKELKNSYKQEIQIIFTKIIFIKLVFSMIWLMVNSKMAKRIQSDKVLRNKGFEIAKNQKYDGCQRGLASMVYKFFIKHLLVVVLF